MFVYSLIRERKKGHGFGWMRKWKRIREEFGRGNVIKIYCLNKTCFQLKKKMKQNNNSSNYSKTQNKPTNQPPPPNPNSPVTLGLDAFTETKNLSKSPSLPPLDLQGPAPWSRQPINHAQHAQTAVQVTLPAMKTRFETLANSKGVLSISSWCACVSPC